jgi:ubiquinone/menaquinone biosynthesis C-methylase UbiE
MTSSRIFDDTVAQRLQAVYQTPEMVAQRRMTIEVLSSRSGDHILDIGTGPGLLALDLANHIAPDGHVTGIDVSADMLTLADRHRQRSPRADLITFREGDATALPFADASFHAVVSTQVFEYIEDVDGALAEAHRVLRHGGRLVVLDTDWDSLVWHAGDRDRMHRVITAWTQRFADPHLPTTLQRRLHAAGFDVDAVQAVPVLNADFDADTYSARHIEIISDFVTSHGVPRDDAIAWANDLRERARLAEYFFSLNRYVFTARKP